MITRVQVKNYRSLADVDVELGPLTVLVGRNGAGKSTVLDALRFVRDALDTNLSIAIAQRNGLASLRRWSPQRKPYDLRIALEMADDLFTGEYAFTLSSNQQGEHQVKHERCLVNTGFSPISDRPDIEAYEIKEGKWVKPPARFFFMLNPNALEEARVENVSLMLPAISISSPIIAQLQRQLLQTSFYSIFPNLLRPPQKPVHVNTLLDNGGNLATVLEQVIKDRRRRLELITALAHVVNDIDEIRVRQVGGYLVTELRHIGEAKRSAWFELAQESDGTLRLLALLTALYQGMPRSLIAIEEPELNLHPGALAMLSDILREVSEHTQVVITTQSPDLISQFKADELRVVERVEGQTRIGPVDERQREIINEQLFSAGDLLRIEGLHLDETAEVAA